MADDKDSGPPGNDNDEDLRIEIGTLLFELRLGIEAAVAGIQRIATRGTAKPISGELGILLRLIEQSAEALNALDAVMERYLRRRGTVAHIGE
jgi:hypothetical protein